MNYKEKWEDLKFEIEYRWDQITDFFYNIYYFFRNIRLFRKDLWDYRNWDHEYCINIYCTALETLKENIYRNGHEVDDTRMKKVEAMEELLNLLQHDEEDVIWESMRLNGFGSESIVEAVGKAHKAKKKRIFEILGGQDDKWLMKEYNKEKKKLDKLFKKHPLLYFDKCDTYWEDCNKAFDGTDAAGWWD